MWGDSRSLVFSISMDFLTIRAFTRERLDKLDWGTAHLNSYSVTITVVVGHTCFIVAPALPSPAIARSQDLYQDSSPVTSTGCGYRVSILPFSSN